MAGGGGRERKSRDSYSGISSQPPHLLLSHRWEGGQRGDALEGLQGIPLLFPSFSLVIRSSL